MTQDYKKHDLIRGLFRTNRASIFYTSLLGILLVFPLFMAPVFKQVFTDAILINNTKEWLAPLLALMCGIALFSAVATWLQKSCLLRLCTRIELSGAASYMWRLFNAPFVLFRKKNGPTLLSGAEACASISKILCSNILPLFPTVVSVIVYYIMMFRINSMMSFIVLALIVFTKILNALQGRLVNFFAPPSAETLSPSALSLRDAQINAYGLQSIETFKSTASEMHFFQQMISSKIRIINAAGPEDEAAASAPFGDFPRIFFLNSLLCVSGLLIMNREFTIGSYLAFQAYAAAFFSPLNDLLRAPSLFTKLGKKLEGLYRELGAAKEQVLTAPAPPLDGSVKKPEKKLAGYIEFNDVSIAAGQGVSALEHFSLSVKPGQRVALVGKSGCGKSTVIKLLQGLYTPDSGDITIDGIPVSEIDRETFINSVGCANQEMNFFIASVRDNITLWDDAVSDGAVYQALEDVELHQLISSLDGAYDHILEENGRTLSGGQQQRLEIARAILYNPSIVLMDEASSALGTEMAEAIEAKLKARRCAILQVTEIFSMISDYDEILVLDKGSIAHRGTHADLLLTSAWYAALFNKDDGSGNATFSVPSAKKVGGGNES
ncbi:MAG: ATP-binding cassette domain-containing protein [Spirochaetaceae bacterium]|nr:ATP-binding cassette domain-containing protein [Spirochaetaceae bacterium]